MRSCMVYSESQQLNIDLENHDEHSLSHLKGGVDELMSWKPHGESLSLTGRWDLYNYMEVRGGANISRR